MISVIIPNIIVPSVIIPNFIVPSVIIPNVILPSVIMPSVNKLKVMALLFVDGKTKRQEGDKVKV